MKDKNKITYVDLFCGSGGLSLGFEKAGFENVFSVDIEPVFCETYRTNFPTHFLINKDISEVDEDIINNILLDKGIDRVDIVIGGPPCQGFSMAGIIGRKFIDDERNHLFKEFARIVEIIRPRFFVMENVARLYTHNKENTKKEILETFKGLGYNVKCKVLNSVDYGVPQFRRRIIFIGTKVDIPIKFPERNIKKNKTVKEAIEHLPSLNSGESSDIPNHEAMNHTKSMLEKMKYITDGGDRGQIPQNLRPKSGDIRKYIRYKSDEPSVCITGDMRKVFHYLQNRALTVRELAAIQSFPDDFIFKGSRISQQQQVGNSVPPLMAKAIAEAIKTMIQDVSK